MCVCVYIHLYFFHCFLGTPRRRHLSFRALVLAGTCSTGTFCQTHAISCTFPALDLRLLLCCLTHSCCVCLWGGDKHRNIWCFWNVERLLFCRSFRLQPMAQNGLTCDIAAVLPSSPCGMCMDWHGALYMQPSESPAKLCPVTCCPWVSFPAVNVPSGHTAVGTAADRALCLVQHFSLQDTCAPWFSVLCRSAVMSFSVSLRSMCA